MERKVRVRKKYVVLGGMVLFLIVLAVGYLVLGVSRPNRFTAYEPLTGRVFHIKWEEIKSIDISGGSGRSVTYKDPEELRVLAEYWNGFRCDYRYPQNSEERSGGCRVHIYYLDGGYEYFDLAPDSVLIGDIWYIGETDYFERPYYRVNPEEWDQK